MAITSRISEYEDEGAASIEVEDDGKLWLAPAFTWDGGVLFVSVTDDVTETEAGMFLSPAVVEWVITYLQDFMEQAKAIAAEAEEGVDDDE